MVEHLPIGRSADVRPDTRFDESTTYIDLYA